MKRIVVMGLFAGLALGALADNGWELSGVTAVQHWPFDRGVDIDFRARQTDGAGSQLRAARLALSVNGRTIPSEELSQSWILGEGRHRIVWTPSLTGYPAEIENASFAISVLEDVSDVGYLTVDLASGKFAYKPMAFSNEVNQTDLYKTTSMAFRYIPSTCSARWSKAMGKTSFRIGSDGKRTDIGIMDTDRAKEGTANITLTRGFFIGVFPMTRKQYALLGGSITTQDSVPVRSVTYDGLRGQDGTNMFDNVNAAYCFPISNMVKESSPIGRLRVRSGLPFDFPTEAQWEYAARAGSEGEYIFDDTGLTGQNINNKLNEYGANDASKSVGTKLPNAWGLYDLIGCCHQWTRTCAKLTTDSTEYGIKHTDATDPVGATPTMGSAPYRVCKGSHCGTGGGDTQRRVQRLAYRLMQRTDCSGGEPNNTGCRLSLTLDID